MGLLVSRVLTVWNARSWGSSHFTALGCPFLRKSVNSTVTAAKLGTLFPIVVGKSHEGADLFLGRRSGCFHDLPHVVIVQSLHTFTQPMPNEVDVIGPQNTFAGPNDEVSLLQSLEQLSQRLDVIFPTGCVDENIVPVEQNVVYVLQDSAQSSLQSGTAVYHPKRHSQEFPMAIRCHESSFGDILLSNFDLPVSLTQINFLEELVVTSFLEQFLGRRHRFRIKPSQFIQLPIIHAHPVRSIRLLDYHHRRSVWRSGLSYDA